MIFPRHWAYAFTIWKISLMFTDANGRLPLFILTLYHFWFTKIPYFRYIVHKKTFVNEPNCILFSTYQLHEWGPRPPGHKHQSCSRPACVPGQVQQDTSAGTTFPGLMHGHEPSIDRPVGRRGRTGREVWGGFAAERGNLLHGCSNSSASQRLLGLKLLPALPRENKMESRVINTSDVKRINEKLYRKDNIRKRVIMS